MGKEIEGRNGGKLNLIEKGEVRNPTGKSGKSFKRLFKEALKQPKFLEFLEKEVTHKEAMALLIVKDATDEDQDPNIRMKAALTIMEKLEGTAINKSETKHKIQDQNVFSNLPLEKKMAILKIAESADNDAGHYSNQD